MDNAAQLNFAYRFFLLSLCVLCFTYLSGTLVSHSQLNNTFLLKTPEFFVQEPAPNSISLSLLGPQAVDINTDFEVLALLDANDQPIQAVDLVLEYDPAMLEFKTITPTNTFFESIPVVQKGNRLYFSTLATNAKDFSGHAQLASLAFSAKKAGSTQLQIIHQPDDTTDSNVILNNQSTDSLNKTENININVL